MILFAAVGVALLSAAVYELAGPGPARIAAWVLALEPANIFFSSLLHKEPLMYLAEGLVVFGGAVLWKRGNSRRWLPMIAGCLIAMATRPYVGWFLTAAAAAVVLHASLTRQRGLRSLASRPRASSWSGRAFIPVVWDAVLRREPTELQQSQDANASDERESLAGAGGLLHAREPDPQPAEADQGRDPPPVCLADRRTRASSSARSARSSSSPACACWRWRSRATGKRSWTMAAPLVYPAAFMLVAYAISAGNAGTAYRYRTHLVGLAVCLVIVLLAHRRQEQEGLARMPRRRRPRPIFPD